MNGRLVNARARARTQVGKKIPHDWGPSLSMARLLDDSEPLGCCHWLSACFCGVMLRAKRVGHMPVLFVTKGEGG